MNFSKSYIFLLLSIFTIGCVKELDFDQANDIEITPILESSLVYFDLNAESTVDKVLNVYEIDELPPIELFNSFNYPATIQLSDTTSVEVFNDAFFTENLIEADILYQFTNSTNIPYTADVRFLNEDDELIYNTLFVVNSGSENTPFVMNQTDNFTNDELNNITNTQKIAVNFSIEVTPDFLYNPVGSLTFKSSGTFYFLVDEE